MDQRQYDAKKVPDLIELRKQLSEANKLRHKHWTQLRAVRNQIGRYIRANEITEEQFESLIKGLSKTKQEYLKDEWSAGREIPIKELEEMLKISNLLWNTSQFKEELRRKRGKVPPFQAIQDPFFCDPI